MGVFGKLFGSTYNDEEILTQSERAIAQDPVMNSPGRVGVSTQEGIVTLTGQVNSEREKAHVETLVQTALDNSSTAYERIENQLQVA